MPDKAQLTLKSSVTLEIKSEEKGEVEAIVATLGVVDKDGDIITKDAVKDGSKVAMSSYGHDTVWGSKPVGKGTLHVEGNKLKFTGRIFLQTTDGRETFEVLKEMGADQEWSFAFQTIGYEVPSEEQKKEGAWRVLTKLDCFEVSPVIIGAGVGTRTVDVKEAEKPAAGVIDPAVEAARLETERRDRELLTANETADRRFKHPPAGMR